MRNTPDSILMFAAGFGSRMKPLTDTRPKPLVEVGGQSLIDQAMRLVRGHGIGRVVVNLHYKSEMIREHFAKTDIIFSDEQPDILDTGGGLKAALPLLGPAPVFTMNTDAVWSGPNPLSVLCDEWRPEHMDALLLCIPRHQTVGHAGVGDFQIDPSGRARRGPGLIYSGLQIMKPKAVLDVEQRVFSLNLVWDRLIATGRLFGVPYTGSWCDVGQPSSIQLAEDMLARADV